MTDSKKRLLPRRSVLAGGAALAAAPALAGCQGLLPGQRPAPEAFRLTPKSTFSNDLPEVRWQLVIETPLANAGLSTTRIALMRSAMRIEYYARANWTDRAPQMVQTLMVESFENSERIVAIGRESLGLRSDFVLKTELREFQAEYPFDARGGDGEAGAGEGLPPKTRVNIAAKLVQMPRREIVASSSFEGVANANRDELPVIIESFDVALGRVLKGLVEWTLLHGEEHYQRQQGGNQTS